MTLLQRYPHRSVAIVEKESGGAAHQTGRNSGVIHAGVYYQPGSLKAQFCQQGAEATKAFCLEHEIPFEQCGKLIVATSPLEYERLQQLIIRAQEHQLDVEVISQQRLQQLEPNIAGIGALLVKDTAIVDYKQVTRRMLDKVVAAGGQVLFEHQVNAIDTCNAGIEVTTSYGVVAAKTLISCAGIMSDRIVSLLGLEPEFEMIPFRGEYFLLPERHNQIVKHLIYPVPDPSLPFLGVHLTKMIDGTVTVGPNAVLAPGRESYRHGQVNWQDCRELLTSKGLRKVVFKHFKASVSEFKNSVFKQGYLHQVRKYCPQLRTSDLLPYRAGIRAQAITKQGQLIDDFLFVKQPNCLIVANAPSPAATSAIPIAQYIVEQLHLADED
ncbi:L-2-hydroxyglutarate oxidase [Alteromonadales bacterium alter-6D02]|nr:L-2-hydroxyglutarate oxidase [Alteromonadales bacterium alter-6D02]